MLWGSLLLAADIVSSMTSRKSSLRCLDSTDIIPKPRRSGITSPHIADTSPPKRMKTRDGMGMGMGMGMGIYMCMYVYVYLCVCVCIYMCV